MVVHPKLVPWRSSEELETLKQWFYDCNGNPENRLRAIQKVQGYQTRGNVPIAVESTASIMSTILKDDEGLDALTLRMSYTLALIRFVNGILDPAQQSQFAIPLTVLARNLDLDSYFVEVRHAGTHEELPSLESLRYFAERALDWLWKHYWDVPSDVSQQRDGLGMLENGEEAIDGDEEDELVIAEKIKECFKEWRRLRRNDPFKVVKRGDGTPDGKKYWKILNEIENYIKNDESLFFNALLYKEILISKKKSFKVSQYSILYSPMFDEFNVNGFVRNLVFFILEKLACQPLEKPSQRDRSDPMESLNEPTSADALNSYVLSSQQIEQLVEWIEFFLTPRIKTRSSPWLKSTDDVALILDICRFNTLHKWTDRLQQFIKQNYGDLTQQSNESENPAMCGAKHTIDELKDESEDPVHKPAIEEELRLLRKRLKSDNEECNTDDNDTPTESDVHMVNGWSFITEWKPTPLGVTLENTANSEVITENIQ